MIAKKICMVGAFAVGKTSLVRQFVESIYSEKYQTTIGVKISKKQVEIDSQSVQLMIWDIEGVDIFTELKTSYLRGSSGVILVIDGTRPKSYENVHMLLSQISQQISDIPMVLMANKYDLDHEWKLDNQWLADMAANGIETFVTSAKSGENVNSAFLAITERMMSSRID